MTKPPDIVERRDWQRLALYALGVALVLGGLETVKAALIARSIDPAFGWWRALGTNMPWWLLWVPLVSLVVWLGGRFPLQRGGLARAVSTHALTSIACSVAHLTLSSVIVWAASSSRFQSFPTQLRQLLAGYFFTDLVTYWAIAVAYAWMLSHRRLRAAHEDAQGLALRAAQLEAEAATLRAQVTEARLDALRMELNPHFLFNTLNSVAALAQAGDQDTAVRMLAKLGELLRRTLDGKTDEEVPLAAEVELLQLYLDIERMRFGERLSTAVEIPPALAPALVPPLILQPLVENAVRHGVAAVRGPVRIEVSAGRQGEDLEVVVRDSGPGLPGGGSPAEGIGLRNVRSRLAALYGDRGTLAVGPSPLGGTEARCRLPARLEEGGDVGP